MYSTDTIDVFQEGTVFPGVKLYRNGERSDDIYRTILANSRLPRAVEGDILAQVSAVRLGAQALTRLLDRFGLDTVQSATEDMFDQSEALVRDCLEGLSDGTFRATGEMDDNGVCPAPVPFDVSVEIQGSDITVTYGETPESGGPINCPIATTVAASRIAIGLIVGAAESPNEGFFRPITVQARPGTIFHPVSPAPVLLYSYLAIQAVEAIFLALSEAAPTRVPASSGGCLCGLAWWGTRESGEGWGDGAAHPIGQGAHACGDGASSLIHPAFSTAVSSVEPWEAKNPWVLEKFELAADSGGAGQYRGGLGVDIVFRVTEDCTLTTIVERTKNRPWGLAGGHAGRANSLTILDDDGERGYGKQTDIQLKAGARVKLMTGGGGGFGDPAQRGREALRRDLRNGFVTHEAARVEYGVPAVPASAP